MLKISPKFGGVPISYNLPLYENRQLFIYVMAILISLKVPPFRIDSRYQKKWQSYDRHLCDKIKMKLKHSHAAHHNIL